MTPRRATFVAGAVTVATLLAVGAWGLWRLAGARTIPIYSYWGEAIAVALAFPTLGYLIVRRQPDNRVGWLFVGLGATVGPELLFGQSAIALRSGWFGLLSETFRLGGFIALGFLVLLYPTGHLLSPRWRWAGWLLALGIASAVGGVVLSPGPIEDVPFTENPIASPSLGRVGAMLETAAFLLALGCVIAGIVSLFIRYRRSGTVGRQQIKLFALAPAVIVVVLVVTNILLPQQMEGLLGSILWGSPAILLPAAATVAIRRHGLYDIDRIISRTVSYGIVTAILGSIFAVVALVPATLVGSTGDAPDWAIVVATVLVGTLFRPLRRRIQGVVDRRFNRDRYDLGRTIEAFSARLRQEIDIDTLAAELKGVVARTMQPAHVSLWLRKDA